MDNNKEQEMSRRSQPVPSSELNRRLLERAEKMTEGKKTIGSEEPKAVFSAASAKEDNTVDKNMFISELRSRKTSSVAAAAAVIVLVLGSGAYVFTHGRGGIETETEPVAESGVSESSEATEGDYYTVNGSKANAWAEPYLAQNDETIGYIRIPGLEMYDSIQCVDTPVAASVYDGYYMTHAFDKSFDEAGCIFTKADKGFGADGSQPQVIQLFGYDNTNEAKAKDITNTFGSLSYYTNIVVLKQAPIIEFKTIWQDGGEYAIFGVLEVQGDALGIGEVEDVKDWADWIREESYFDVDIDCGADDKYLVLNAHNSQRTTYRLFAKKLDEGDDKQSIIKSYRLKDGFVTHISDTAHFSVPMPQCENGMFILQAYMDGERVYSTFISEGEDGKKTDSVEFSVSGEGTDREVVVKLIDPLSSDSRTNTLEYARYKVDFETDTVTLIGDLNTEKAAELISKYSLKALSIPLNIPVETKDVYFDFYIDGMNHGSFYVDEVDPLDSGSPVNFIISGKGRKNVSVFAKKTNAAEGIDYAAFEVDFDNGRLEYAENGREKTEKLIEYCNVNDVTIDLPVPSGITDMAFDIYINGMLRKTEYLDEAPASDTTLKLTAVDSGKKKVTVYARKRTEKIGFDYAEYDVDFSTGKYEYSGSAPDTETLKKYIKGLSVTDGSVTR